MRPAAHILDGSAMGLSGLCLFHCLGLPVLAALMPGLGTWAQAEWVHVAFVLIAAPLSGLALLRPAHGARPPLWLAGVGATGLLLLTIGAFGPAAAHLPATLAGSVTLAGAHLLNWRRQRFRHVPG